MCFKSKKRSCDDNRKKLTVAQAYSLSHKNDSNLKGHSFESGNHNNKSHPIAKLNNAALTASMLMPINHHQHVCVSHNINCHL